MFVAIGTSHCSVFSISSLTCEIERCRKSKQLSDNVNLANKHIKTNNPQAKWSRTRKTMNSRNENGSLFEYGSQLNNYRKKYTSSLVSMDCNRDLKAFLTVGGNPWYNVSLILGGREAGRAAYNIEIQFNPIWQA